MNKQQIKRAKQWLEDYEEEAERSDEEFDIAHEAHQIISELVEEDSRFESREETCHALAEVIRGARRYLSEKYGSRKRLNTHEVFEKATLTRDIVHIETQFKLSTERN